LRWDCQQSTHSEGQKRLVNVGPSSVPQPEPAKLIEPGKRALDRHTQMAENARAFLPQINDLHSDGERFAIATVSETQVRQPFWTSPVFRHYCFRAKNC
jgi:hypothetical protein